MDLFRLCWKCANKLKSQEFEFKPAHVKMKEEYSVSMKHVNPFVARIINEIEEEINRKGDGTDENSREIAREYMKIHAL